MELRHLRYFVAVADELHFGRAAEQLFISQPPLTRQIQQLEQEMGVVLLTRTKRSVRLTEAGAAFLERARQILLLADEAVTVAQRIAAGQAGALGIGFVGSATYTLLPEILRSFRAQYPGIELLLHEMSSGEQIQALQDGRIDLGFVRPSTPQRSLAGEVILREPLMAALPDSHSLAASPEVSFDDLRGDPFILFPRLPRPSYADHILALCAQAGFTPTIIQETLEIQTALGLVAGNLGVAIVPASVSRLPWPGVVYKPLPPPAPTTEMAVAYRDGPLSPALANFLEIVHAVARELSATGSYTALSVS
ncbi:LysR family transcriptional regulator [Capsulimonas corticalis]|uniref:LysR family transcriptional regulator n=1 Tax=Capsulimonas corticalis TaxID=2219043 RepID=A0A402CWM7_9BACT|nr:LysR family transcriptional regulator [Capsulimonas corticalis]BDI34203.1 LysR family transcriptional regulator [Capsulimonas corticalis]